MLSNSPPHLLLQRLNIWEIVQIFIPKSVYNDVSNDKMLSVMSHGHWGGLGDFIISRLQSFIPFLMKMLKMSTFGKLVLIDNWNNIIYISWTFAGKDYLMAGFCLKKYE